MTQHIKYIVFTLFSIDTISKLICKLHIQLMFYKVNYWRVSSVKYLSKPSLWASDT